MITPDEARALYPTDEQREKAVQARIHYYDQCLRHLAEKQRAPYPVPIARYRDGVEALPPELFLALEEAGWLVCRDGGFLVFR